MRKNDVLVILIVVVVLLFVYTRTHSPKREVPSVLQDASGVQLYNEDAQSRTAQRSEDGAHLFAARTNMITDAVQLVQPAVVSIYVTKTRMVRRRMGFFFDFYGEIPYNIQNIGSGVIFTEDGYIISNAHVAEGATEIKVVLPDNREFDGTLIGVDSVHDVAILKIEGDDLPFAKLGNSSDLIIGEWAVAVGNPYGSLIKDNKPSVSVGVISAVNRDFARNEDNKIYRRMIQTDAAINPGNSGGPLVNIYGEVIGINTFILSESGGSVGIGFAIPIDRVKKISEELIQYGKRRAIWLDFDVQDLSPMIASYYGLDNQDGVMVVKVRSNTPASKAGLLRGDIITEVNGSVIKNFEELQMYVSDIQVGDVISFTVLRKNKEMTIRIDAVEYK
jgi:serine protease Do